MIKKAKRENLYFKHSYGLEQITELEAIELELGSQLYYKKGDNPAIPVNISKCFENAEKFEVEAM